MQPQTLNTLQSALRNNEILNFMNRASGLSTGNHTSVLILVIGKLEKKLKHEGRDSHIATQPEKEVFW